MDPEQKDKLVEELQSRFVLISKGTAYYIFGGFLASAIAIIGWSYASAKSTVGSSSAAIVLTDMKVMQTRAEEIQRELQKILDGAPSALAEIPSLIESQSEIEKLREAINDPGRALSTFDIATYSVRKFGVGDNDDQTHAYVIPDREGNLVVERAYLVVDTQDKPIESPLCALTTMHAGITGDATGYCRVEKHRNRTDWVVVLPTGRPQACGVSCLVPRR